MSPGPAASSSRSRPRSPDITAIVGQHVHIVLTIRILNGKLVVFGRERGRRRGEGEGGREEGREGGGGGGEGGGEGGGKRREEEMGGEGASQGPFPCTARGGVGEDAMRTANRWQ